MVENRGIEKLHACLEATGGWSEDIALALRDAGYVVSLVNPARIKAYAQSEMLRTKTDRIDAGLIARFCSVHRPEPWVPPAPEVRVLQGFVRRQQSLIQMRTEEQNRLQAPLVARQFKNRSKRLCSTWSARSSASIARLSNS